MFKEEWGGANTPGCQFLAYTTVKVWGIIFTEGSKPQLWCSIILTVFSSHQDFRHECGTESFVWHWASQKEKETLSLPLAAFTLTVQLTRNAGSFPPSEVTYNHLLLLCSLIALCSRAIQDKKVEIHFAHLSPSGDKSPPDKARPLSTALPLCLQAASAVATPEQTIRKDTRSRKTTRF